MQMRSRVPCASTPSAATPPSRGKAGPMAVAGGAMAHATRGACQACQACDVRRACRGCCAGPYHHGGWGQPVAGMPRPSRGGRYAHPAERRRVRDAALRTRARVRVAWRKRQCVECDPALKSLRIHNEVAITRRINECGSSNSSRQGRIRHN